MVTIPLLEGVRPDRGNLKELLGRNNPVTVQHGHEVFRDQLLANAEKNERHYVANTSAFETRNSIPQWYFGRGYTAHTDVFQRVLINPVFGCIAEAYDALRGDKGDWKVPDASATSVRKYIKQPIDVRALGLTKDNDTSGHFNVSTNRRARMDMSVEQLFAAKLAFAGEKSLDEVMEARETEAGKEFSLPVYTLMPEYVLSHTKDGKMIARVCRLGKLDEDSLFNAADSDVVVLNALRGVRRQVAADGGSQQNEYAAHLKHVLAKPIPDAATAANLLQHVKRFYNSQK